MFANRLLLKITLLSVLLSYGGCSDKNDKNTHKNNPNIVQKEAVSKPKPIIFEFPDSNNQNIKITFDNGKLKFNNFPNKIVMVAFFGKHCPPCLAEIPHLVEIQKKYKKDFQILAIQVQERMDVFQRANFIKAHNINYILVDDDKSWNFTGFMQQALGWKGTIPFMLLFNTDGSIFTYYSGMVPQEMIEGDIKKILGKYPQTTSKK